MLTSRHGVVATVLGAALTLVSCSVADCESTLTTSFDSSLVEVGTVYSVKVCVNDGCSTTNAEFGGETDTFDVIVKIGDLVEGPEAYVTVDLRDPDLNLVAEHTGSVPFNLEHAVAPGGAVCWDGAIAHT